jgi:dihydroorotase
MYEINFPSPDEMNDLKKYATPYEFKMINFVNNSFLPLDKEYYEIHSWVRVLAQRLHEINFSYLMTIYYYQKGIPDKPYYDNESNKYFPCFLNNHHWLSKEGFEYYSEFLLFKSFSALETMAHILSINYDIKFDKVSFSKKLINRLLEIDNVRFAKLKTIFESQTFITCKMLRNNSAHNISSGQIDSGILTNLNGLTLFSIGNYTPTSERLPLLTSLKDIVFDMVNITRES